MGTVTIKTNNRPVNLVYWHQLPEKVKQDEFDWVTPDIQEDMSFFPFKGQWYCLDEFMRIDRKNSEHFSKWDGYSGDSYFSGKLVRMANDGDSVVVASYYS